MTLQHHCPTCHSKLSAPDIFAGRRVRCPNCSREILMPELEAGVDDEIILAEPVEREPEPQVAADSDGIDFRDSDDSDNSWDLKMLDRLHKPQEVRQSLDPPAEPAEEETPQPSFNAGDWMQRMFAALLDPRSIQWLLTLGGGLMILGGLIWLISWGVLQNPLVVAAVLGTGSLAVLGAGWWLVLKTRYQVAGRAVTFLGCVFLALNLWFYHAQNLLPLDQGLWVAAVVCVVIYVATVRVLRDPLFLYAVEAGVTLTAVLVLGNFGLALSATHLSMLLMVLALISIHGHRAFPESKDEFNRDAYGLPLFWSGHLQLAAAVGVLFGSQLAGWTQGVAAFFDLPENGILLTNSRVAPGLLWLAAAYAYVYSDLAVRRVGAYMYLAAISLIMAEATLIGLDTWGMEGMIGLLAVTSAAISIFAAAAPAKEERLARVVAPLAFLIGVGPLLMGLLIYAVSTSVIATEFNFQYEATWAFVGSMILLAASNRIAAYTYRAKAPGLAAVYLSFTAASLLIAAAGALNVMGLPAWQQQTPLLLVIPIGYLLAARLWRGQSPERPLAAIAQVAIVFLMLRGVAGAVLNWNNSGNELAVYLPLTVIFAEVAVFYGAARWFRNNPVFSYLAVAAACLAAWSGMMFWQLPAEVFTLGFATIGVTLLVASKFVAHEERTVYSVGGQPQTLLGGPGAEVARAGHGLLSITLLSTIFKSLGELLNGGASQVTLNGLEWLVMGVAVVAAIAGACLSTGSGWRRGYALAGICLAALTLFELNLALALSPWRKAEILSVTLGCLMLAAGYIGRFRETNDSAPNDLVSVGLWTGSLMTVVPLLLAVFTQWNLTDQFALADEFAFIAITLLVLVTGIVWRVKASTMLGGVSLATYLVVLTISVIYQPQIAVGIYLAAGGALLFGLGLVLSVYRDRLAAIPERVAQRQGLFSVIAWR